MALAKYLLRHVSCVDKTHKQTFTSAKVAAICRGLLRRIGDGGFDFGGMPRAEVLENNRKQRANSGKVVAKV